MKDYKKILEGVVNIINTAEKSDIGFVNICAYINEKCPELKESEDERIRKAIHIYLDWLDGRNKDYHPKGVYTIKDMIAWLEKQGEHANFRNKIEIGDKVTRNEDGVLVNLSQLNRVAKKQCEQKPWNEEDEYCRHQLIAFCENCMAQDACSKRCAHWLKSLKDKYTWKPSEEQMNALNYVVNLIASSERPTENDLYYNVFKDLREQLKKLRGE